MLRASVAVRALKSSLLATGGKGPNTKPKTTLADKFVNATCTALSNAVSIAVVPLGL